MFYSYFWFDARRVPAKFHASACAASLYGRYRLAKTRWGAGHGWCLGIYTHKDMHDVLEVETN